MLQFRNLAVTPDSPVAKWGVEGIVAAIDRGSLAEWGRIIQEVDDDPHGPVALDLEEALEIAEDRGIVVLLRRRLTSARATDAEKLAPQIRAWIAESGLTRAQVAARIGTSRSRLSTYETGKVMPSAATARKIRDLAARRRAHLV